MTSHGSENPADSDLRAAVRELCERMKRVEARLGIELPEKPQARKFQEKPVSAAASIVPAREPESLEFELGQNWFALIGIIVLAIGVGFVLSLPFEGLAPIIPPLGGLILAGVVFTLSRLARASFEAVAKYLRGAGMLLLFFSALRLFYFGNPSAFETGSLLGRSLLLLVVGINLVLAWRRASPQLFILALITGYGSAVAIGSTWFLLITATALVALAVIVQLKMEWRMMAPAGFMLAVATYTIWAIGNPVTGNPFSIRAEEYVPVYFILVWVLIGTVAVMLRPDREKEDTFVQVTGLLVCGFGFGVFFLHNLFGFADAFIASHSVASVLFLSFSLVYWKREESWFSTFIYAMTGYMALSFALIKAFGVPEVFVALSLQSLVVLATAIYFRSRFIIVANCFILLSIIVGYVALTEVEQGMSFGFGIVALVTARVLNLKKDRLALTTELMRNVYLIIAFVAFPYALYYLVPETYVVVAWAGLALFYYGMNLIIRNRKYRWMGHMTLLLTAFYVVIVGSSHLDSKYRILSFLVLGSLMLVVSLVFTLSRSRKNDRERQERDPG